MKTKIIKVKGDWEEVVNDCRMTVGKGELGKKPSSKFIRDILIAEHSPIRDIWLKWQWDNIKYWVAMHWKTHHWEGKVRTQRTDRTGVNRDKMPQDVLVEFTGDANCQNLIDTARKRLCYMASPETREYMEDLKWAIKTELGEEELADVLQKNCIYRCGCCELQPCGYWDKFLRGFMEEYDYLDLGDIRKRYDFANELFEKEMVAHELRESNRETV